jgi:hypothetical protein
LIGEVVGHVLDQKPAPPYLKLAQDMRTWGAVDIMSLPAGLLPRMNTALSVYIALSSYKNTPVGRTVDWTKQNPQAWKMVSSILAERKRGKS